MPSILTIIPFYGGEFKGHSDPKNRAVYLLKTIASVKAISSAVVVGVQNENDYTTLVSLDLDVQICFITIENPRFLPAALCKYLQTSQIQFDFIYFTEADQVLYLKQMDQFLSVCKENPSIYFSPHRLSRVPENLATLEFIIGSDLRKAYLKEVEGVKYTVENKSDTNTSFFDECFYVNHDIIDAYGGAFLCHYDLFKKVNFSFSNQRSTEFTAGFDLFITKETFCLKSINILDFYVDHLSGAEFYRNHIRVRHNSNGVLELFLV